MNKRLTLVIGLILIIIGGFGNNLSLDGLGDLLKNVVNVEVVDVGVDEPSEKVSELVSPIKAIVTDKDDRIDIAVFHKVLGDRMLKYQDMNTQELNDLYVEYARGFFGDSLNDKYVGLDQLILSVLKSQTGDELAMLGVKERGLLAELFYGIAWHLQK